MRANQEEKLKPYVVEMENRVKHSLTLLVGLYQMRANQEAKLKPYVVELENRVKHSLTLLVGLYQVRANQEEKLKPYVVELENSIKQKLDKAKQAKEKQEEMLMEKLAEHTRSVCVVVIPSTTVFD